jgi:hypothetical protein
LRVVFVDFGDDEHDECDKEGEGQTGNERIRREVNMLQRFPVVVVFENVLREMVELGEIWDDCFVEVGAFREGFDGG